MSTSVIDEYLVKLGSAVDQSGMQAFYQALKQAAVVSEESSEAMAGAYGKAALEIIGGFAAIGLAAIGVADKVAMADQEYRLFALDMHIGQANAMALKLAMDTLGESIGHLTWDPELNKRALELVHAVDKMNLASPKDTEAQLKKIRDIRFEFQMMDVEAKMAGRTLVATFMKDLGLGPDELLGRLKDFNAWIQAHLPEINDAVMTFLVPAWTDVKEVMDASADAMSTVGLAFTNLVGALTGDDSLEGAEFNAQKLGKALYYAADGATVLLASLTEVLKTFAALVKLPADLIRAMSLLASGHPRLAADALEAAAKDALMVPTEPFRVAAPIVKGLYHLGSGQTEADADAFMARFARLQGPSVSGSVDLRTGRSTAGYGAAVGASDMGTLSHAIEEQEGAFARGRSPNRPQKNNNPGNIEFGQFAIAHGAIGTDGRFAIFPDFATGDAAVKALLSSKAYRNLAVPDAVKKWVHPMPGETASFKNYESGVMREMAGGADAARQGDVHVGSVVVHVTKTGATNEHVGDVVAAKLRELQNKKVQRNLAEFQNLGWSG